MKFRERECQTLSLTQYSPEQLKEMSMVEIAYLILSEKKQAITFKELMDEISRLLDLTQEQVEDRIAQFYTDINIDGRFICIGENNWGLRSWYPYDQIEEETQPMVKTKKKKAKKVYDDDLDIDEIDDDLDFDELDDYEEDEEDFDDTEEDFDDELIDDDYDDVEDDDLNEDLDLDDEEEEL
jgi:DNA-directed RNA polymerase subunit delta